MCCFSHPSILLVQESHTYSQPGLHLCRGASNSGKLTAISCYSLGSALIFGFITFWRLLDILFIDVLLLQFHLYIALTLCPKQEWGVYIFLIYSSLKPLNIFCFVFLFLFLHYFRFFVPFHPIAFIFPPAYGGTSGLSLHLLILPVTGGRYDLFQNC